MEESLFLPTRQELGDKTITTNKYALIRIVGEKDQRRINWDTYQRIKSLPETFDGSIEIEELGLVITRKQIVKMEEKEEAEITQKNFTQLPTETIFLDENFNLLKGNKIEIERTHDRYYNATCHFVVRNGEKQYYLEPNSIKFLLLMARDEDPDYPHYVLKALKYGRDIREIEKEQEEERKKRR